MDTTATYFPDPRKITNIEIAIADQFFKIADAYRARLEIKQRYWKGLSISSAGVPDLKQIEGMEAYLDVLIRESKRREI